MSAEAKAIRIAIGLELDKHMDETIARSGLSVPEWQAVARKRRST